MKHLHIYLTTLFLLLLATACTDEKYAPASGTQPGEGYRITVSIPAPMEAATRSIGDALTSDYVTTLPLFVLVFDENGFFTAFEQATVESYDADTRQGTYTVDLPPSDGKCVLHFVLGLSENDFATYTPDDSESSIFSRLTVGKNTDAYWQRVEVDHVIKTLDKDGETVTAISAPPLTDEGYIVKLVRNFAQVSLENNATEAFELQGFTIVNEPLEGTVAPYSGHTDEEGNLVNGGFASFELPSDDSNRYTAFTTLNPGFGGSYVNQTDESTPTDSEFTLNSKYLYERNQDDSDAPPAYILLKGTYDNQTCYYKLDFVTTDKTTWITSYMNLYRNFHYMVSINSVTGAGYATIDGAMNAAAANNIGASIEVSDVNTIQDGKDQLYVSTLDTLLVTTNEARIYYEFREGIDNGEGTVQNSRVIITPIGGLNTEVISSFDYKTEPGVLKINPAALPDLMAEQEFAVTVENSGLSRRIRVRVHAPFRFNPVDCEPSTADTINSSLTLVVRLPENMPRSVFPLVLDIEPKRKTIYPDVAENRIPVYSEGNYTFSYQATVTYEDYRENIANFFVFKTNMAQSSTYITVTNPYFVDESEGFTYPYPWEEGSAKPYNVARFTNNGDLHYDFFDVELSSPGNGEFEGTPDNELNKGTFTFSDYNPNGKKITLSFKMHREGDSYTDPHAEVRIFADYLDWTNIDTSTGDITGVRDDGQCIFYQPYDPLAEQSITFTIKENYARETIQLSSYDHSIATVNYKNIDHSITVCYASSNWDESTSLLLNGEVEVYDNNRYSGQPIFSFPTDRNGNCLINPYIIGYEPSTQLYFRCYSSRRTYYGNMTVSELLDTQELKLTRR